ncbi:MAG: hypothetical protein ACOCY0_02035 [Roseicyclus sp.]
MRTARSTSPMARSGASRSARLDERQVTARARRDTLGAHGTRPPPAVLIAKSGEAEPRDVTGDPPDGAALEALRPGGLARFFAAAGTAKDRDCNEEEKDR